MKCPICGKELELRNKQIGTNENGDPIFNEYAICRDCKKQWNLDKQRAKRAASKGTSQTAVKRTSQAEKKESPTREVTVKPADIKQSSPVKKAAPKPETPVKKTAADETASVRRATPKKQAPVKKPLPEESGIEFGDQADVLVFRRVMRIFRIDFYRQGKLKLLANENFPGSIRAIRREERFRFPSGKFHGAECDIPLFASIKFLHSAVDSCYPVFVRNRSGEMKDFLFLRSVGKAELQMKQRFQRIRALQRERGDFQCRISCFLPRSVPCDGIDIGCALIDIHVIRQLISAVQPAGPVRSAFRSGFQLHGVQKDRRRTERADKNGKRGCSAAVKCCFKPLPFP